jgi:hypothetical protein
MYLPYQMLRHLAHQDMTAAEQREADEEPGRIAAAVTRSGRRVTERVPAMAALPAVTGRLWVIFRKGEPAKIPSAGA